MKPDTSISIAGSVNKASHIVTFRRKRKLVKPILHSAQHAKQYYCESAITNAISRIARISTRLIHMGDKTHHHDQSILSRSFNVTKTTVSNPVKPIPLELDELFSPLISFSLSLRYKAYGSGLYSSVFFLASCKFIAVWVRVSKSFSGHVFLSHSNSGCVARTCDRSQAGR